MKKLFLSLGALFAVGIASAQSYPKQPDPSIVEVVPYQKEVKAEAPKDEAALTAEPKKEEQAAPDTQPLKKEEKVKDIPKTAVADNTKQQ